MIEMNGRDVGRQNGVPETPVATSAERYWEDFYHDQPEVWSGRPNPLLVREVAALTPGTALDLGCGNGGDTIWLARQGWRVTAVDVSATALRRAATRAAEAGTAERIEWARHDLAHSFPDGSFDLVSAQFLHSPVATPGERERILRRAADRVASGGILLITSHAGWPSWVQTPPFEYRFPTIPETLRFLELSPDRWRVEVTESVQREVTGPDGQLGQRSDTVLRAKRTQ